MAKKTLGRSTDRNDTGRGDRRGYERTGYDRASYGTADTGRRQSGNAYRGSRNFDEPARNSARPVRDNITYIPDRQPIREYRGAADVMLFFITLVLLAVGMVMVLSASSYNALVHYHDALYFFKRQFMFMIAGLFAMFLFVNVKPNWVKNVVFPALIVCIVMLVVLPVIGIEVNGSRRWLGYGAARFAPAEVAKPVIIVYFAYWLSRQDKNYLKTFKGYVRCLAIMMIVPAIIVIEDLGTAICVAGTLICMMIVAEIPWRYLIGTAGLGVGAIAAMVAVKPYRLRRITAFLDPFQDPLGDGYQAVQSLYAIGSGKLTGVGLGAGRQKLLYLPEGHTDFIFSNICEELGFIGGFLVIALFILFIWRGIYIATRIEDPFKSFTAFGLTAVIGIQAMINIGVAVGAMPVTGITLPFISYGGTSLFFMLCTVGFLLNMSRYMKK